MYAILFGTSGIARNIEYTYAEIYKGSRTVQRGDSTSLQHVQRHGELEKEERISHRCLRMARGGLCWRRRPFDGSRWTPPSQLHRPRQSTLNRCRWALSGLWKVISDKCRHSEWLRTICFTLIPLVAHFAEQLCNTLLPVDSNRDRLVVMAEEARKVGFCTGS